MTNSQAQRNREIISAYWRAMNDADAGQIADIVRAHCREDNVWHGPAPYQDIKGVDALIEQFWRPLWHAFPDLRRCCDVLLAGRYREQDWVSASGYFRGTFREDWHGIAANGAETLIRFGEVMALEEGKIVKTYFLLDLIDVMQARRLSAPLAGAGDRRPAPAGKAGQRRAGQRARPGPKRGRLCCWSRRCYSAWCARTNRCRSIGARTWSGTAQAAWAARALLMSFSPACIMSFSMACPAVGPARTMARYAEGRFAVSTGWPSLVAVHDGVFLGFPPSGNELHWRIMDFWERIGDKLVTNWVHIDMINIFKQIGVDVFDLYQQYRREKSAQEN